MKIIGWDVGGAHLKGAHAEDGRIVAALQVATPLWLGLDRLEAALAQAKDQLGEADSHVVTMTGELADVFASRAEGVARLATIVAAALAPAPVSFYAGRAGILGLGEVGAHAADIASANWHACAALVGHRQRDALLIDMGSTTTDIIPIAAGTVAARGYTDAERLATGELVYTGLVRSHLMATASHVPFAGAWTPLMNEFFANTSDVHRILGHLPDGADQQATADGRGKSAQASRARLARIVGRDVGDASDAAWRALAQWFAERQLRSILDAAMLVLSAGGLPDVAPVVAAGIGGEFLREASRRLGRPHIGFDACVDVAAAAGEAVSHVAPAAAVAILASAGVTA